MRVASALLAPILVASLAACDGNGPPEIHRPLGTGGSTASTAPDAGDGGAGGAASSSGSVIPDAGESPVLLAVTPSAQGDPPTASDRTSAALTTAAAGARAVVLPVAWRTLAEDPTATSADAKFYAARGLSAVLDLRVVDGVADRRPDDVAMLAWDDPASVASAHAAADAALATFGAELREVVLGHDVDVYLAKNPAERPSLRALLLDLVAYVRQHPPTPAGVKVGVGFSFHGAAVAPDPAFGELLAASDVAAMSYVPGIEAAMAPPAADVAADLDAIVAAAHGKPVVLTGAGAPTSDAAGGSEASQATFFATFFQVLAARRVAFDVVELAQLHDVGPSGCATLATEQGEPPDGAYAAFVCSTGLFTLDDEPRPAWKEVLRGLAVYAMP